MKTFWQLRGLEKGPISIVLAGVHGDEICGPQAFEKLLPQLKIKRGKVFFIIANPKAVQKNVRQISANLNRLFRPTAELDKSEKVSYEFTRITYLKKYLTQASALLDIHASCNPKSSAFVICEPNAWEISKYLPTSISVSGFDQIEPGGTDYFMNRLGKIGICIECGYRGNRKTVNVAEKAIYNFLIARGHMEGGLIVRKQTKIKMFNLYRTKTNFRLTKRTDDFTELTKGKIIGLDGVREIKAPKKCIILFAQESKKSNQEAFLLGEKEKGQD